MTNSGCISMFSLLKKAQLELKRVETHLCNNSERERERLGFVVNEALGNFHTDVSSPVLTISMPKPT